MSGKWSSQAEYEAIHGTQEEQAAKQAYRTACDGPWRLFRWLDGERVVLDNSVRSTGLETERARVQEWRRTGILWEVERIE